MSKILDNISSWLHPFKKHWRRWNEIYLIPFALLLWKVHIWLLPLFDPMAAPPDAGIFSYAIAMVVVLLIAKGTTWLLLKFTWPGIYSYLDIQLEQDLWEIEYRPYSVLLGFLFYALPFLAMVLIYKTGF